MGLDGNLTNQPNINQHPMKQILALFATCALALGTAVAGEPTYEDISLTDLKEKMEAGEVTLLDVNGTKKYTQTHIPGAIDFRANKDEIASMLPEDKDALIVAYCGGPSCSAYKAGLKAAQKLGYTNVRHLSLGISGWIKAGEVTEAAEEKAEEKQS